MLEILLILSIGSIVLIYRNKKEKLNEWILIVNSSILLVMSVLVSFFSTPVSRIYPILSAYVNQLPASWLLPEYFDLDNINIYFLILTALLYFGVAVYNRHFIHHSDQDLRRKNYYTMFMILFVFSMTGLILSTHLTLLWIFIELSTLATTFLIIYDKSRNSLEAGWKYLFICSIGIALAFLGIILLTMGLGENHSLFFNDLYLHALAINPFWLRISFIFILIGMGTKMGLAPVHTWLPDAHSEAPAPVSALLSGALLNVAFLGILRFHKLMLMADQASLSNNLLMLMGFMSLLVCAVYMFKVKNYKRMLAYSSVENMGILAIGTALGGIAFFAAMLHMLAHSLTKAGLFITSGNIYQQYHTKKISQVKSLLADSPVNGLFWIAGFISISGIPPFPIFISEFFIIKRFLEKGMTFPAILFVFLITFIIAGMGLRVLQMIAGKSEKHQSVTKQPVSSWLTQALFLILLIVLGCYMPSFIHKLIVYSTFSI